MEYNGHKLIFSNQYPGKKIWPMAAVCEKCHLLFVGKNEEDIASYLNNSQTNILKIKTCDEVIMEKVLQDG